MDVEKRRNLQYWKQRHALISVNPDTPEFLDRFENADATRRMLLATQRLKYLPSKAFLAAQKRRMKKQKKGAKKGLRGEVAEIKRKQKIFEVGQRRFREEQEPRLWGGGPGADLANVLAGIGAVAGGGVVGGAGAPAAAGAAAAGAPVPPAAAVPAAAGPPPAAGGFHYDPAVERLRLAIEDRRRDDNFRIAQDRIRLEGHQLDLNRHVTDRDRDEIHRQFNIQHEGQQHVHAEEAAARAAGIALEQQRIDDEAEHQRRNRQQRRDEQEALRVAEAARVAAELGLATRGQAEDVRRARAREALEERRVAIEEGANPEAIQALQARLGEAEGRIGAAQAEAEGRIGAAQAQAAQDVREARDAQDRRNVEQHTRHRADMAARAEEVTAARLAQQAAEEGLRAAERRQPPPPRIQERVRVERVEVPAPAQGLSDADRRWIEEGNRQHQSLIDQGIERRLGEHAAEVDRMIDDRLQRTGREDDADAARVLREGVSRGVTGGEASEYHTPRAEEPWVERPPYTGTDTETEEEEEHEEPPPEPAPAASPRSPRPSPPARRSPEPPATSPRTPLEESGVLVEKPEEGEEEPEQEPGYLEQAVDVAGQAGGALAGGAMAVGGAAARMGGAAVTGAGERVMEAVPSAEDVGGATGRMVAGGAMGLGRGMATVAGAGAQLAGAALFGEDDPRDIPVLPAEPEPQPAEPAPQPTEEELRRAEQELAQAGGQAAATPRGQRARETLAAQTREVDEAERELKAYRGELRRKYRFGDPNRTKHYAHGRAGQRQDLTQKYPEEFQELQRLEDQLEASRQGFLEAGRQRRPAPRPAAAPEPDPEPAAAPDPVGAQEQFATAAGGDQPTLQRHGGREPWHPSDAQIREGTRLLGDMSQELQLQPPGRRRGAGIGANAPTGWVLENPTWSWVKGINPGGRVNITGVEQDGTLRINTGKGSRALTRAGEAEIARLISNGQLVLMKGNVAVRPPKFVD